MSMLFMIRKLWQTISREVNVLYKVLVVDDSSFMRDIIKDIINAQENMEVVGEAENGTLGFEKYKEISPDLTTLDIVMANENGISALKKILEYNPSANVMMVSSVGQDKYVNECLNIGAKGFVIKPFTEEDVVTTINKILS